MLDVLEANELLERAEECHRAGRYDDLFDLLHSQDETRLTSDRDLAWYWARVLVDRGENVTALGVLEHVMRSGCTDENSRVCRRLLNLHAIVLIFLGNLDASEIELTELLSLCEVATDEAILADATSNLGVIADIRTNWNSAIAAFQRALIPLHKLGAMTPIGHCHHNLGMSYRQIGRYAQSAENFELALEYYRREASEHLILACESERALLAVRMGDVRFAEASARRLLARAREIGHRYTQAEILRTLAIAVALQDAAQAKQYLGESLKIAQKIGARLLEAESCEELAVLAERSRADGNVAQHYLTRAMTLYCEIGTPARAKLAQERVRMVCLNSSMSIGSEYVDD